LKQLVQKERSSYTHVAVWTFQAAAIIIKLSRHTVYLKVDESCLLGTLGVTLAYSAVPHFRIAGFCILYYL